MPSTESAIYFTFDDGPIPQVTPWVLEQLKKYEAKATFFCIGDNIQKHPEIFKQVFAEGHRIGNHTQNHLNGWKTSTEVYLQNVFQAEENIQKYAGPEGVKGKLFRAPYGRMKEKQARLLRRKNYKIIMWDVISVDYDARVSPDKCFKNVVENARSGSIIVFHDSLKAEKNLREVLPRILEYYHEKGFAFKSLEF